MSADEQVKLILDGDTVVGIVKMAACPFCGEERDLNSIPTPTHKGRLRGVCCPQCGTMGPVGMDDKQAIDLWNERVNSRDGVAQSSVAGE